jgi:hypothetical protein
MAGMTLLPSSHQTAGFCLARTMSINPSDYTTLGSPQRAVLTIHHLRRRDLEHPYTLASSTA